MKIKQKTMRVFEIEAQSGEDIRSYFEKNRDILKEFFLVLKGDDSGAMLTLAYDYGFVGCQAESLPIMSLKKEAHDVVIPEKSQEESASALPLEASTQPTTLQTKERHLLDRPIRSGEEITRDGDLVVYGRVNSGSKLRIGGNLAVFGTIEGTVICDGEYAMFRDIGQGHLVLQGEIIEKDSLPVTKKGVSGMKKATVEQGKIVIKDLV